MTIVFPLAALQAFFLVASLLTKSNRSVADRVLLVWLAGIGIHTSIYYLYYQFGLFVPLVLNLYGGFPLLQGPLLPAYIAAVVGLRERPAPVDVLHLLPFTVFPAIVIGLPRYRGLSVGQPDTGVTVDVFSLSTLLAAAILVSVPIYIAWSLAIMRRADAALAPGRAPRPFFWTGLFVAGLGIVWLFSLAAFVLGRYDAAPPHLVFWGLALFVYAMSYLGLTRTAVFSEPEWRF